MKSTTLIAAIVTFLLALVGLGYHSAANGSKAKAETAEMFSGANNLVGEGKLEEAIAAYRGILKQGEHSSAIYYNLANAQLRSGDSGAAILNYERAAILDPGAGDISANLKRARKQAGAIGMAADRWWTFVDTLSPNAWSIVAALSLLALSGTVLTMGFRILTFPRKLIGTVSIAAFLAIAASVAALITQHEKISGRATVLTENTPLRVSPFEEAKPLTTLPSGKTVYLDSHEKHGDFRLARLESGQVGWLKSGEAEFITDM